MLMGWGSFMRNRLPRNHQAGEYIPPETGTGEKAAISYCHIRWGGFNRNTGGGNQFGMHG
jgi:hypothetical protein